MKKFLPILVLASLLIMPAIVLGDSFAPEDPSKTAPTLLESGADLEKLIVTIGNWVFTILLGIAAVFLIVAGYFFITAGGNPENITKARQMLINALIGVAIGLGAQGLVKVIGAILGYTS